MSRGRARRRWLSTGVTAVAVVAAVAASAPARCAATSDPAAAPPTAAGTAPRFTTLPPGAALPTDAACAAQVRPEDEARPENATANGTRGDIRLPADFFDQASHDERAETEIIGRVTGDYTGTTGEILQWVACKWGVDEDMVRAQAQAESSLRQSMKGDWSTDADVCAPDHGLGVDGRPGECPESWGILQVRYQFFSGAFPDAISSTAFNADTAYAVWRACFEGYEEWLADFDQPDRPYRAGDAWGCMGRWFSGEWYDEEARDYIACVTEILGGRPQCD